MPASEEFSFCIERKVQKKYFKNKFWKEEFFLYTSLLDSRMHWSILGFFSWLLYYIIFLNSLVTKWCKLLSAIFHLSHFTTWQTKKANFIEIHCFSPQYQCVFPLNGPCPVLSFLECPERNLLMVSNS